MEKINTIPICKRCHRKLKDEQAIERGYGSVCWKKIQKPNTIPLFSLDKKGD